MSGTSHYVLWKFTETLLTPVILEVFRNVKRVMYVERCGGMYGAIKISYEDNTEKYIDVTDFDNKLKQLVIKVMMNI